MFQRYISLLGPRLTELGGDPAQIKPSQNGYDGLPEHGLKPHPHRPPEREPGPEYTGKIAGLVYSHFGDFEGFILELFDGEERRFANREHDIEDLARRAWENRTVVTVVSKAREQEFVSALILRRH